MNGQNGLDHIQTSLALSLSLNLCQGQKWTFPLWGNICPWNRLPGALFTFVRAIFIIPIIYITFHNCTFYWIHKGLSVTFVNLCAAGSWTSWQAEVRWSECATTPHLPWPSTLVLRRAASSAHSCTPCTHTTVQQHTAPMSSSNLQTTQRW